MENSPSRTDYNGTVRSPFQNGDKSWRIVAKIENTQQKLRSTYLDLSLVDYDDRSSRAILRSNQYIQST
ncbi:hypothetical protein H6G20_02290 [Desertifilum sp. FACHB-1129]|uniref:Uncharacterized protein n=1 Tax=Geitlerinema calcuttense NRMC-F 0142 TaxID=2922238 RepID=A0ABT7LYM4_9CYAN|nr:MULTISPECIES: hypothetical protein [Cyanophyceae]MCD8486120.1 hypothetical protein [Desertifilum sp.]MDA0209022.1 hypothetical protein [Cyanobacteria bacterium FC1]MDI9638117.1 hypothetical protein [Geitlerinema splendidum]MDL5044725.1 hypothetical protein [Oscillatoria amoena NRMC-F 0135]MBD2310504.1 hypothetical protein [Desertifilum sp. FACHB-1129]